MGNKLVATGVTVSWDDAKHPVLNAREGVFDKTSIPKGDGDEFTPARIVADLKVDLGDAKAATVTLNNVHLQIAYTSAKQVKPTVGWWDKDKRKWIKFKEDAREVTFTDNLIDVTLPATWPTDPPIGVYP